MLEYIGYQALSFAGLCLTGFLSWKVWKVKEDIQDMKKYIKKELQRTGELKRISFGLLADCNALEKGWGSVADIIKKAYKQNL